MGWANPLIELSDRFCKADVREGIRIVALDVQIREVCCGDSSKSKTVRRTASSMGSQISISLSNSGVSGMGIGLPNRLGGSCSTDGVVDNLLKAKEKPWQLKAL